MSIISIVRAEPLYKNVNLSFLNDVDPFNPRRLGQSLVWSKQKVL